jgi:hypothetical protein
MSLWQVSQEELYRCCQQKHCSQAGQIVPGIEQSGASQQSSFMISLMAEPLIYVRITMY